MDELLFALTSDQFLYPRPTFNAYAFSVYDVGERRLHQLLSFSSTGVKVRHQGTMLLQMRRAVYQYRSVLVGTEEWCECHGRGRLQSTAKDVMTKALCRGDTVPHLRVTPP